MKTSIVIAAVAAFVATIPHVHGASADEESMKAAPATEITEQEDMRRDWKASVSRFARRAIVNVDEYTDVLWRRFADRMGFNEPRNIAAYYGYSNGERIWVRGRLLANKAYGGPQDDDGWWDNLEATYQRWESDEIPGAPIELRFGEQKTTVTTDDEGYYTANFVVRDRDDEASGVQAVHRAEDRTIVATHWVLPSPPAADYLVISDMDDTVIETGITNLLLSARLTFLYNARTRKPLTGVGALYHAFTRGMNEEAVNPVIYVSNSGWNMFDLLRDFMELNDIPRGPLLLRDLSLEEVLGGTSSTHKFDRLNELLVRFPDLPVVLVGDSGQHDAEIYTQIVAEHPGRVQVIYIRDVDPDEESDYDLRVDTIGERSDALGVPLIRVENSAQIAKHAAELGLLPESVLDEVIDNVREDESRPTIEEEASESAAQP